VTEEEYRNANVALGNSKGCFSITTWISKNNKLIKTYPWTAIYLLIEKNYEKI